MIPYIRFHLFPSVFIRFAFLSRGAQMCECSSPEAGEGLFVPLQLNRTAARPRMTE